MVGAICSIDCFPLGSRNNQCTVHNSRTPSSHGTRYRNCLQITAGSHWHPGHDLEFSSVSPVISLTVIVPLILFLIRLSICFPSNRFASHHKPLVIDQELYHLWENALRISLMEKEDKLALCELVEELAQEFRRCEWHLCVLSITTDNLTDS